jgi:hypothetical protein
MHYVDPYSEVLWSMSLPNIGVQLPVCDVDSHEHGDG